MNYTPPQFAHLPLLFGPDRRKLSKRDGAVFVSEFAQQGFLPSALVNFVALLGWSPRQPDASTEPNSATTTEAAAAVFLRMEDLIDQFDLAQVHKAPAIVDRQRLAFLNTQHLRRLPLQSPSLHAVRDTFAAHVRSLDAQRFDAPAAQLLEENYMQAVLDMVRVTYSTMASVCEGARPFFQPPAWAANPEQRALLVKTLPTATAELVDAVSIAIRALPASGTSPDDFKAALNSVAQAKGSVWRIKRVTRSSVTFYVTNCCYVPKSSVRYASLLKPLRVAVTGSTVSQMRGQLIAFSNVLD